MPSKSNVLCDALISLADEFDEKSNYLSGFADGLRSAIAAIAPDYSANNDNIAYQPTNEYRPKRQQTQRPVLEALKVHDSMTVTEIMKWARAQGHDLLRPTVKDVLERLQRRGLVASQGHRYQLSSAND